MSKFESTVSFHNNVTHKRRVKTPSFSSILLDAIYQSIDDDHRHHHHHHDREYSRTTPASPTRSIVKQSQRDHYSNNNNHLMEKASSNNKQRTRTKMRSDSTLETVDLRRAIMIESWMEKQQQPKQPPPLLLPPQPPQKKHHFHLGDVLDQNIRIVRQKSVPSRPTSSCDNTKSSNDFSSCFTNLATRTSRDQSSSRIFTKTKSRALKIYGDLKRSKQQSTPTSPGRRFAAFLNSIFRNAGSSPARSSPSPEMKLSTPTTATTITSNSTCSSASSFSRSCLSKTTSSSTKSTPGTKRSVRFFPVIVDEDSRPCGHISLHKNESEDSKKLVSSQSMNANNKWSKEKDIDALMMMMKTNCSDNNNQRHHVSRFHEDLNDDDEEMEEEEDDDGESCASSDLFELENFSSIGVSRYNEELPVYGTTSLKNITA